MLHLDPSDGRREGERKISEPQHVRLRVDVDAVRQRRLQRLHERPRRRGERRSEDLPVGRLQDARRLLGACRTLLRAQVTSRSRQLPGLRRGLQHRLHPAEAEGGSGWGGRARGRARRRRVCPERGADTLDRTRQHGPRPRLLHLPRFLGVRGKVLRLRVAEREDVGDVLGHVARVKVVKVGVALVVAELHPAHRKVA